MFVGVVYVLLLVSSFLVCFVFVFVCFFLFLMKIIFPCNSCVWGFNVHSISVFHFSFWFLLLVLAFGSCFWFLLLVLVFVCFLFQDVPSFLFFLFFCLLSCFVSNHSIRFSFALILFSCCSFFCFGVLLCLIFGYLSKHLSKNSENSQNEECRKKDTLTRAVSTGVLTNRLFSFFVCL